MSEIRTLNAFDCKRCGAMSVVDGKYVEMNPVEVIAADYTDENCPTITIQVDKKDFPRLRLGERFYVLRKESK